MPRHLRSNKDAARQGQGKASPHPEKAGQGWTWDPGHCGGTDRDLGRHSVSQRSRDLKVRGAGPLRFQERASYIFPFCSDLEICPHQCTEAVSFFFLFFLTAA